MPKVLKTAVPGILVCLVTVALCAQDSSRKHDGDRVLKFPSDRSIGTVYIREPVAEQFGAWNEHNGWERLADAQGELQVSAGHQVRLDVGTVAARDLSPLDELRPDDLVTLRLGNSEVTDDELKHVGRLTGLVDLRLELTRVTDAGIAHLSELTSLRNLDCEAFGVHRDGHGISDESAETLSWLPNLQSIDLRLTKYTDRGLAVLARLPKLRSLELSGTKVTDAGLKALRGKATLRSLSLGLGRFEHCEITDEAMDDVATLTGLRWLRLNGTELTDAGLKQLSGLSDLNYLSVDDTSVTADGVRPFAELPRLEYLRIPFSCGDQEAHVLATFPALKRIIADFDSIGDDGVVALTNAPTLEWLDLMSPGVTERGF